MNNAATVFAIVLSLDLRQNSIIFILDKHLFQSVAGRSDLTLSQHDGTSWRQTNRLPSKQKTNEYAVQ